MMEVMTGTTSVNRAQKGSLADRSREKETKGESFSSVLKDRKAKGKQESSRESSQVQETVKNNQSAQDQKIGQISVEEKAAKEGMADKEGMPVKEKVKEWMEAIEEVVKTNPEAKMDQKTFLEALFSENPKLREDGDNPVLKDLLGQIFEGEKSLLMEEAGARLTQGIIEQVVEVGARKEGSLGFDPTDSSAFERQRFSILTQGQTGEKDAQTTDETAMKGNIADLKDAVKTGGSDPKESGLSDQPKEETANKDALLQKDLMKQLVRSAKEGEGDQKTDAVFSQKIQSEPLKESPSTEGKQTGVRQLFDGNKNTGNIALKITEQTAALKDGQKSVMKLSLKPQSLGEIRIALEMDDGKLSGKILVESAEIRQLLNSRIDEIQNALKQQKIEVSDFEVDVGSGQAGKESSKEQNPNENEVKALWAMRAPFHSDSGTGNRFYTDGYSQATGPNGIDLLA
ncbi:MAG TPA: hypothetical protein DHN33_03430 [Eubacteriaceae bacterium]|nr:hypothetical protein [Eubacteriaceae bacterium]